MTSPPPTPTRSSFGPLKHLPAFLFEADRPAPAYILKAWLLVLLPSIALSGLVALVAPDARQPDIQVDGTFMLVLLAVITPLLETLLMVVPLLLLNRLSGPAVAVPVHAAGWGAVHSLSAPIWGLVAWWPFLVFGTVMLVWRERGLGMAILVVTAIHALQNGVIGLVLLLGSRSAA